MVTMYKVVAVGKKRPRVLVVSCVYEDDDASSIGNHRVLRRVKPSRGYDLWPELLADYSANINESVDTYFPYRLTPGEAVSAFMRSLARDIEVTENTLHYQEAVMRSAKRRLIKEHAS